MRRKDILIITAVLIIITFGTVFAIYYALNGDNIFSKVQEEITEVVENKGKYHSNGWETAIVDNIKYNVPIPVGFTYVEGNKETGIIIKNNDTEEKYMWIPYQDEVNLEGYDERIDFELDVSTNESIENIQKYNGFYVAIDDRSEEEKFEEYLKENTEDFETYYELKSLGYEAYKNVYKEVSGEEFDLNSLENVALGDNIKLDNESKTSIFETHTITQEELINIIAYNNKTVNELNFNNLKTLTLSISKNEDNEYPKSINGTRKMLNDYQERIKNAIEYISENTNYSESKIKKELGKEYENLVDFEIESTKDYDKIQDIFSNINKKLTKEFGLKNKQEEEVSKILAQKTIVNSEKIYEKYEDENGDVVYIPKGFTHESGSVKTGFKIKNTDNLSFIWIPVKDVENIKEEFINNAKKSNLTESVIEDYETYKDDEESKEYKNLIESIKQYGGFYISEAELGYDKNGNVINKYRNMIEKGGEGTGYNYVSNGDYYRNVAESNYYDEGTEVGKKQREFKLTYENAVKTSKELYEDSETVVSHLTYGIEYDAVVNYLLNNDTLTIENAFKDSTKIGKYKGTEEKKSLWEEEKYINGIYGLAGNLEEITQEKDGEKIILRGGSWYEEGTSKPLASKIALEESKIDKGQDEEGNEILLGSVGFRACLYIKTEYEESEKLETNKEVVKKELKNYIKDINIKLENNDFNYFNNKIDESTNLYENPALNDILEYIEERIDAETSSTSFNKILQYGKDEINKLVNNIAAMLKYPEGEEGYTYGETNDECWQIKEKAIKEMQELSWNLGVLKDKENKEISYSEIRIEAENQIKNVRNTYRTAKIKEYIDDYPTAADKDYTVKIKEKAKEEMSYTNDLANLANIAVKYQEIIEVANKFVSTEPSSWDYYESWKDEYLTLKEEYAKKIANEAKNKEEAESLAKEGMEKVNAKSSEVIAQKKEEERKAAEAKAAAEKAAAEAAANNKNQGTSSNNTPPPSSGDKKNLGEIKMNVGDTKGGTISGNRVSQNWKSENESIVKVEKRDDRYYLVAVKEGTTKVNVGSNYYTVVVNKKDEKIKEEYRAKVNAIYNWREDVGKKKKDVNTATIEYKKMKDYENSINALYNGALTSFMNEKYSEVDKKYNSAKEQYDVAMKVYNLYCASFRSQFHF